MILSQKGRLSLLAIWAVITPLFSITLGASTPPKTGYEIGNSQSSHWEWKSIEEQAKGQTVNFFAWGADPTINRYIEWAAKNLAKRYQIKLNHIKVSDTSETVSLMLAEQQRQLKIPSSQVDLIWLNGQHFSVLKQAELLLPHWVDSLPNYHWLNANQRHFLLQDFGVDTELSEMPWGLSHMSFYYNQKYIHNNALPNTPVELLEFSREFPGRFTYPAPPDFLGTSFLKQTLSQLSPEEVLFYQPVETIDFDKLTAPLWQYLDELHPNLYQQGRYFTSSQTDLLRLFDDEILLLGVTFNQANLIGMKARYDLPETTHFHTMSAGSLSNIHFLSIGRYSQSQAAALVSANFLLSPLAQAKKNDPAFWGDETVLDRVFFQSALDTFFSNEEANHLSKHSAFSDIKKPINEFHPSWDKALSDAWQLRYR